MKKKFFIGLFIFAAIGLFLFAHLALRSNNVPEYQPQQNLPAPIEIPSTGVMLYEEAKAIDKPMVAMFYVDWCSYCRKYMPVFGELAAVYKDKYSFVAINCDNPQYKELVNSFHIMAFPSLFVIDEKIGHKFSLNMAATTQKSIAREELDNYLKVRKNIVK